MSVCRGRPGHQDVKKELCGGGSSRKSLADDIRKRCRKIWGVRHPLDVNFNTTKEMEELTETRAQVKHSKFAEALQERQEAIQRVQSEN